MLEWHHDQRASAEQMLKRPWLDMPANYTTKYTEVEYQKLQLKKQMQAQAEQGDKQEPGQEMGELIESDAELYNPDDEEDAEMAQLIGSL